MTIKKYIIKQDSIFSSYDFGENMLNFGKGNYGIIVDFRGCGIDDNYINSALEENEKFIEAAREAGYDTSFKELTAFETYTKMTGAYDYDLLIDSDDIYLDTIRPFYDNFEQQVYDIYKYLEEDERISILEDNHDDALDIDYVVEFDDAIFEEVKAFIDKTNAETEKKNSFSTVDEYNEYKFNTPIFKATYSNPGSLEVYIKAK